MKIAIQSESNVAPALPVTSESTQRDAPDFKSALTSAVASSTERSDKASQATNAKSSSENNKRKDTPAQTSTANVHLAEQPAAQLAMPIGTTQNTIVLPVTTYPNGIATPESFAELANEQTIATSATGNVPRTTVGQSSQTVANASGPTTSDAPASDAVSGGPSINVSNVNVAPLSNESIIPATVAESASDATVVLDDAGLSLPLNGVAIGKATGQEGISTVSSAAPTSTMVSSHTEVIAAKQVAPELVAKASHSFDATQKKQDSATDASVSASSPQTKSEEVRPQSVEKMAAPTEAPVPTIANRTVSQSAGSSADLRAASISAQGASLASGTISSAIPGLTPAVDFQGVAAAGSGKAQSAIHGSAQAAKPSTTGQAVSATGSSAKGKDASSDVRDKQNNNAGSDSNSSSLPAGAANASTIVKVSEPMTTVGHDSSSPAGTGDITAMQMVSQANQAVVPNHEQSAGPQTGAADSPASYTQGAAAGAGTELQNAPGISGAQLTQSLHHSEMRLGMQSAEFGDISISTSINRQALSAQISIDHSELSKALAVHLPAIEAKLGSVYGVEARVEVRDGGGSASYSNPGQQSKERSQSQGVPAASQTGIAARMNALNESTTAYVAASTSRLDIRI